MCKLHDAFTNKDIGSPTKNILWSEAYRIMSNCAYPHIVAAESERSMFSHSAAPTRIIPGTIEWGLTGICQGLLRGEFPGSPLTPLR